MVKLLHKFKGRGEVKGFLFTQIFSNEKGYVYSVEAYGRVWYESFFLQINHLLGCETYPKSKSFGRTAKWFYDKEKALDFIK